ncbi:MAG: polyprenyl synthetase family protein [Planctomycetota bacterium]|nr:MAG: polyprenyl synthetase family protein [Planctomycetota bacterium]
MVGGSETVALPVALAVECVHTFSLIHDDLPAMDDDRLRRGRPTNHTVFGEAEAILAGDWLVPHAFGLLASNPVPTEIVPQLIRTLAEATEAMILGQSADIASEGRPPDQQTVRVIHTHKTAAMMEAACRLGALVGGGTTEAVDALAEYGRRLGLAFQIVDDLLDRTATAEAVGKQTGKDEAVAKQTWPAAHGVHASRAHAREQIAEAIDSLQPFGGAAENLRRIAGFVIERGR